MIPAGIYPPLEDSLLLASVVRDHAKGRVLDMGCGSGIQSATALKNKKVTSVLGVDVNAAAIKHCKKTVPGATFIISDLFTKVPRKTFDTILFNPPYLPRDDFPDDPATIGGKEGWETIACFLDAAPDYLSDNGSILLLFTSLTKKDMVHQLIDHALLNWTLLATNHIAFETYYVYELKPNAVRRDAQKHGVTSIHYFTKGKRGLIHTGVRRKKNVVLKIDNPKSAAIGRLDNEARILKLVNKKDIGPRFLFSTENLVCYEFAKGRPIKEWLPDASKKKAIDVLRDVLRQCFILDQLNLQKEEMHHPHKHIIVGKKTVLLDFERAHHTSRPHNVTQCCQYIGAIAPILEEKGMVVEPRKFRELASLYSRAPSEAHLQLIMNQLH